MSSPPGAAAFNWLSRRRDAKNEARRVRRVVYGFELWSVLKVSLLFYFCVWGVFLLAGLIVWSFAVNGGYIERFENFILDIFNYETFTVNGDELFRWYLLLGFIMVLVMTVLTVIMCLIYNMISVMIGGVRATLVEEETARFQLKSNQSGTSLGEAPEEEITPRQPKFSPRFFQRPRPQSSRLLPPKSQSPKSQSPSLLSSRPQLPQPSTQSAPSLQLSPSPPHPVAPRPQSRPLGPQSSQRQPSAPPPKAEPANPAPGESIG